MTLLAHAMEAILQLHEKLHNQALELAKSLLAPRSPIPRTAVQQLLRRAIRNGAWRTLAPGQRALLQAAARAHVKAYYSSNIVEQLQDIWLTVELATARGKAVLAALTHLLARKATKPLEYLRKGLDSLIALGLQVLNHPQHPIPS